MKKIFSLVFLCLVLSCLLTGCSLTKKQSVDSLETEGPQEIVEAFMNCTLGTLPGAVVDYQKAKGYVVGELTAGFDDPGFVAMSYGIQDGPDSYKVEREEIEEERAEVVVLGFWGEENQMRWLFNLEKENEDWKIRGINPGQ